MVVAQRLLSFEALCWFADWKTYQLSRNFGFHGRGTSLIICAQEDVFPLVGRQQGLLLTAYCLAVMQMIIPEATASCNQLNKRIHEV